MNGIGLFCRAGSVLSLWVGCGQYLSLIDIFYVPHYHLLWLDFDGL
jgi:hypothetical protein